MNYPTQPYPSQPPKKKRVWPWFVIPAIILLCGFGGCATILANSDKAAESFQEGAEAGFRGAASEGSDIAPAGSAVRDGKFEFQVTKVEQGEAAVSWNSLVDREAQGVYVLVHVTVTNISDQAQYYFGQNQTLIDEQGREFTNDSIAESYVKDPGAGVGEINPGLKFDTVLVFDVPADAVPTAIEFHDSAFSGGVQVALQ
ncbi:DUF4352 domain-containing protein [Nocardia flavorosea]|uniref:DUF4352 domain-containing protein n=1 Tax=Nocardia flavorosea TaxID=53429 RepID=A0A846YMU8_9NOCA|nr:DUF4352 domain-containing protein [Nocardia flavorosea]NKY60437.1 DUF4352 domain-containing protein [Nocardia flavorosea]